jgi:hypothetical protein
MCVFFPLVLALMAAVWALPVPLWVAVAWDAALLVALGAPHRPNAQTRQRLARCARRRVARASLPGLRLARDAPLDERPYADGSALSGMRPALPRTRTRALTAQIRVDHDRKRAKSA